MCPYDSWSRGLLTYCEAARCGWIREPLNTLSNLGFIIVGLWIFIGYRRVPQVRMIGLAGFLVGILSAFYHATSSHFGEILDLGSMYLLVGSLCAFNLARLGRLPRAEAERVGAILALGGLFGLLLFPDWGTRIFDLFIGGALLIEGLIYLKVKRERRALGYSYRYFWSALACHASAYGFWVLDHDRLFCHPESSWFQGHAVWHLLGAVTFVFLAKFYRQFSAS
jgi:hypothetical protein